MHDICKFVINPGGGEREVIRKGRSHVRYNSTVIFPKLNFNSYFSGGRIVANQS